MLHRSVSAVIWALPFCPSPFLPHISAAFSLVRRAGCTFSARSISLGWLIQFSKSFVRFSSLTLTLIWIWRALGVYSSQSFFENLYSAFIFNGLSKYSFSCNLIFFIEISCNAAFQWTTACKFGLDGIFTAPIDIRRTACHFFCLPGILAHLLFPFHVKPPTVNS